MSRWFRWWRHFALECEEGTTLAALRIALVSVATVHLSCSLGDAIEAYSNASMLTTSMAREAFEGRWSLFFYVEAPWAMGCVFGVGLLAHLGWLLGVHTRICAVCAWLLWVSMTGRNPWLFSLADQLQLALLTWLMLTPSGRAWSWDARRGRGGTTPRWTRRVFQLQLALVYGVTGALKTGPGWRHEGSAIYYALANPYNRHFDLTPLWAALQPWLLRPLTGILLLWELTFPVFVGLLWLREATVWGRRIPDLRGVYLGAGIVVHGGIGALLYVSVFTPLVWASYLAFLQPSEVRAIAARVRTRLPHSSGRA